MLAGDALRLSRGLQEMRCAAQWIEVMIHRDGPWQTQLNVFLPGAVVPMHRHLRCDSVDVAIAGSGVVDVLPWRGVRLAQKKRDAPLAAQLMSIPRGVWHTGGPGDNGAVILSFQHWIGEPDFISADWEPAS